MRPLDRSTGGSHFRAIVVGLVASAVTLRGGATGTKIWCRRGAHIYGQVAEWGWVVGWWFFLLVVVGQKLGLEFWWCGVWVG